MKWMKTIAPVGQADAQVVPHGATETKKTLTTHTDFPPGGAKKK